VSQAYQTLDPLIIKKILEGRQSNLEKITQEDQNKRERILSVQCNKCNGHLVPRLPEDATKAFSGPNLSYQGWCPACREYSTVG
jgi:hypothetical protein